MQQPQQRHHNSSSPSLSSPPSALSEPGSPTRVINAGRANIEMDEIIVDPSSVARFGIMQQHQPADPPPSVQLTAAGLPRKKPGRKPGSTVKPKVPVDGSAPEPPKQRRPRKPKDPNAPPVQRKRKAAAAENSDATSEMDARSASGPPRPAKMAELNPMRMALDARSTPTDIGFAPPAPKRESMNMQSLLNEEPRSTPQPPPARQMFDPVRGYDPIRSPRPRVILMALVPSTPSAASSPPPSNKPESKTASFTSMTSIPSAMSTAPNPAPPAPAQSKKIAAVVQQERESNKKARSSSSSSPRIGSLKDALPPLPGGEQRSILDFGKARPGEETEAPSITLHVPLNPGESNRYVNFMRMAEEHYGWDALHPRLAASRERKARIAAATAALEKSGSGRDSGEEMDEDLLQASDAGDSNVEMGGMGNGNTSAAPAAAKPARKKRNFKEDEYDKEDDFVDDSELLWEEQAAASRDGFFVYSGPLIPEVEKPAVSEERPRRGGIEELALYWTYSYSGQANQDDENLNLTNVHVVQRLWIGQTTA
ncbi:HIR complex subunit [Collariella sp. IMI 366227]|nr:HIR complex subunit [Collariella sp. IMI 366227]